MFLSFISLLLAALVLYLIYNAACMFIKGLPLQILGGILGLVFVACALRSFRIVAF